MRFSVSASTLRLLLPACLAPALTMALTMALTITLALALAMPGAAQAGHGAKAPDKKAVLVVVFGTTDAEGAKAYDGLKTATEKAFPDLPVRLAYTSAHARKTAAEAGTPATAMPSPAQALARLADEGFTQVAVQSMHIMPGREFHDLAATAKALEGLPKGLKKVALGLPLLSGEDDLKRAAEALVDGARAAGKKSGKKPEALVFVGHGTEHAATMAYPALQYFLWKKDRLALVGTIDSAPSLDDVLSELKARRPASVRLIPLLSVAGDHAVNDIGGGEKDSWLMRIRAAGLPCEADLRGLIEQPEIVALWLEHLRSAVKELDH
ncbi:MAG: sirohydrochlorin cobaltochelatase [Humidesulfovibrio sp.]|nr:sirohydrochlorin cobaltochelatase [Humidesulfovibrio sp.]